MAKKEKKKRVKKCPSVWAPCVFGTLAVVFVFFAIWTDYVGGPRIDTMSAGNITTFWVVGVVMVALCAWRIVARYRFLNKSAKAGSVEQ